MERQKQLRDKEKKHLQIQLDDAKNKLKTVISKTNEILAINYQGEDNIDAWIKDFKDAAEKHKK